MNPIGRFHSEKSLIPALSLDSVQRRSLTTGCEALEDRHSPSCKLGEGYGPWRIEFTTRVKSAEPRGGIADLAGMIARFRHGVQLGILIGGNGPPKLKNTCHQVT